MDQQGRSRGRRQGRRNKREPTTLSSPKTIPWSMEKDVVEVLLEGIMSPDRINLYWFLKPVCSVVQEQYAGFTLCDFVRNPRHCIPEVSVCDEVWRYLPHLLWKWRHCATPLVRHVGPPDVWRPAQWSSWQKYIDLDDTPLEAIDEDVWRRCRRPPPPPYRPYQGVLLIEAMPSFIQVPYSTMGYLVPIPQPPQE
ncbi:VSG-associated, congolense-specific ORF [Trypanosoma congolense IL3000]|uniref:VSG-associated, congolense-specific ORF n=1 Tax=Trypanosoma congolense (strain IL3000) TaxID=1068625 RepID=F9WHA2_TRYCI|nr:VSG-associated, congolense-specific ORF [Trypanosoma congolense IL3000]